MLLPPHRRRSLFDYKIVAAYLAGTLSGALLTALVVWILSGFTEPLNDGIRAALLIIGGVFVWASKHGPLANVIALPETRRQTPAEVFGGSLVHGAFRFGAELGTGVRTYVPSAAPYILLLVSLGSTMPSRPGLSKDVYGSYRGELSGFQERSRKILHRRGPLAETYLLEWALHGSLDTRSLL